MVIELTLYLHVLGAEREAINALAAHKSRRLGAWTILGMRMRLQEGKKTNKRSELVIAAIRQPGLYVEGRVGVRFCLMNTHTQGLNLAHQFQSSIQYTIKI